VDRVKFGTGIGFVFSGAATMIFILAGDKAMASVAFVLVLIFMMKMIGEVIR